MLELEPSGGGCFEVHVDGKEVWSKLKTGQFPAEEDMIRAVSGRG